MLDFYLINDEQPKPTNPEQVKLEFITGLDAVTFNNLIHKGIIDARFDYYSDFRWSSKLVEQINSIVLKMNNSDSDINKLNLILNKALELKCGVLAYCD